MWKHSTNGSGRPLILLHGIGMSRAAWNPVVPILSLTRRVIAFDIAGFGTTPPLPEGTIPTVGNLVTDLGRSLDALGIHTPVDIAGNSLGGAMALEAARRGMARRVVAISPCGLWHDRPPRHVPYVFAALRLAVRTMPGVLKAAFRVRVVRELSLAIPISIGSARMPATDAIQCVNDLAGSTAFEATFSHTAIPLRAADITVPVTVVFGDRDLIVTPGSRLRDHVPPHARWMTRHGWGHVPMWADPGGVADVILEGTA